MQLNKILTQSGEDNPSVKTSSGLLQSSKLPSRIFLGSWALVEVSLLRCCFLLPLLKYFFKSIFINEMM